MRVAVIELDRVLKTVIPVMKQDELTHFERSETKYRNNTASCSSASGQWRRPKANESGLGGSPRDVLGEYEVLNSGPVETGPAAGVSTNTVPVCCGVHILSSQSRDLGRILDP